MKFAEYHRSSVVSTVKLVKKFATLAEISSFSQRVTFWRALYNTSCYEWIYWSLI